MHHAEADELRVLEARNHRQHARLLAPLQLRLEADEAEVIAGEVVLPQLHDGVRRAAGARIDEADRLHRAEAQRVAPAMRHHLDRQAALEELLLVEVVDGRGFRGDDARRRSGRTPPSSSGSSDSRPRRSSTPHAGAGTSSPARRSPTREGSGPSATRETPSSMSIVSARTMGLIAS